MSLNQLEELERRALDAALATGRIEDLDKAANISKQVAEIRKAASDSANQPKLTRNEQFKTWAALLVPFLSIATLAVTIFIQTDQLKATREANEDIEWRETVKNVLSQLSRPATVVADPALAMSLLEPYITNSRYGKDATYLSIHLLSSVPTSDPFQDFFVSHHIGDKWSDIHLLTDTNRKLFSTLIELENRLQLPNPPSILQPARDATIDNIKFVTRKICLLYHANPDNAANVDLRGTFLLDCDLSGLNLASADLTGTKLQSVNLKGVSFGDGTTFQSTAFVNSNWWDAHAMSKPLLEYLMDNNYPYYDNENVQYDSPPPIRKDYAELIIALCQKARLTCGLNSIKYGTLPQSTQANEQLLNASGSNQGPSKGTKIPKSE